MESPRKNNDCYFYYYSTCTKGDSCTFRHEPSALGCETVCSFWKEGKCLNVHCSFRHMELRKNRKAIPCYWETQPGGCLKPHCPFLHKSGKELNTDNLSSPELHVDDISKVLGAGGSQSSNDSDRKINQYASETNFGNTATVDPLVVNFEEESDNESAPTNSPVKPNQTRVVKVKTLEEIRLEKIQAESAAYYSYPGAEEITLDLSSDSADDLRRRIIKRLKITPDDEQEPQNFEVLSLDEIRKRKKRTIGFDFNPNTDIEDTVKRRKLILNPSNKNLNEIKIKTLAEIRAEKLQKGDPIKRAHADDTCSEEVTSTSNVEDLQQHQKEDVPVPAKRQRRKISSTTDEIPKIKPKLLKHKISKDVVESTLPEKSTEDVKTEDVAVEQVQSAEKDTESVSEETSKCDKLIHSHSDSSKLDDILLLDDEDVEESNINLKEEDDILKDIDDLLND